MNRDVETPLHPDAVHKHTTDEIITMYDGDVDWFNNGRLIKYAGHICYCGELFLVEPD
jgi:hypothetical protein